MRVRLPHSSPIYEYSIEVILSVWGRKIVGSIPTTRTKPAGYKCNQYDLDDISQRHHKGLGPVVFPDRIKVSTVTTDH